MRSSARERRRGEERAFAVQGSWGGEGGGGPTIPRSPEKTAAAVAAAVAAYVRAVQSASGISQPRGGPPRSHSVHSWDLIARVGSADGDAETVGPVERGGYTPSVCSLSLSLSSTRRTDTRRPIPRVPRLSWLWLDPRSAPRVSTRPRSNGGAGRDGLEGERYTPGRRTVRGRLRFKARCPRQRSDHDCRRMHVLLRAATYVSSSRLDRPSPFPGCRRGSRLNAALRW